MANKYIEIRNKTYRVHIPYHDSNNKRRFYSKSFSVSHYRNKKDALFAAKKHRDEILLKIQTKQINENAYSLNTIFRLSSELINSSLATKRKQTCLYNKYIGSYIKGDTPFIDIKFDDIQKCLNNAVSIAKDDTINRIFSIWKKMYKYALAKNIVIKNETDNVICPKSDIISIKKDMRISDDDFNKALNMIKNGMSKERESILVQSALIIMRYTGMRPSEVLALEKRNIDLDSLDIYVCQRVGTNSTKSNTITHVKTEESLRHIPIVKELVPIFERLFDLSINDYLFMKNNKELINGTYLANTCHVYTKGLLRPYMLRHQFSTDLLISGTDVRTIQELMGHKSSSMTISYARSNNELKRKALENRKMK